MTFPAKPVSSRYGINSNVWSGFVWGDPTTDGTYRTIATLFGQANLGWVRLDFDWGRAIAVEAYKRDTSQIYWQPIDRQVSRATCGGVNVLGVLAYSPAWAVRRRGAGIDTTMLHTYMPDDINAWAAVVRAAVVRYPKIRHWAIWNEPNERDFFRGRSDSDTEEQRITAYGELIRAAAPHILGNPDGRGARNLVAPEISGGAGRTRWLQRVLNEHGDKVSVVAVHHYGNVSDTRTYMNGLIASVPLTSPWRWDVWLTEAGLTGCNASHQTRDDRLALRYCEGTDLSYINDAVQSNHLLGVMQAMRDAPAASRWAKTFYWHSHAEVESLNRGDDYGLLGGARRNSLFAKSAFTTYATIAGPLRVAGPAYASNQQARVTATPAVPDGYYYVWDYRWCLNSSGPAACDYEWRWYNEGPGLTSVAPYVYAQDYWVEVRARQFAWAGGPELGAGAWRVSGAGQACTGTGPNDCPVRPYGVPEAPEAEPDPGASPRGARSAGPPAGLDASTERLKGHRGWGNG